MVSVRHMLMRLNMLAVGCVAQTVSFYPAAVSLLLGQPAPETNSNLA
jgi:hypothetical protein